MATIERALPTRRPRLTSQLAGGLIELRTVAPFEQPPWLQLGRLAEVDGQLSEEVRIAVARITDEKG
jgi:hypothetical protein